MSSFSTSIMDDIKRGSTTTLAIGMGVLSLVPAVLPVMAQGVRPLVRGAIRGGLVCLEKGQEAVSEIRGVLEEVAKQAKAEASAQGRYHGPQGPTSPSYSAPAEPGPVQAYAAGATTSGTLNGLDARRSPAATGEPDPEFLG